jgi:hypothetical protein
MMCPNTAHYFECFDHVNRSAATSDVLCCSESIEVSQAIVRTRQVLCQVVSNSLAILASGVEVDDVLSWTTHALKGVPNGRRHQWEI